MTERVEMKVNKKKCEMKQRLFVALNCNLFAFYVFSSFCVLLLFTASQLSKQYIGILTKSARPRLRRSSKINQEQIRDGRGKRDGKRSYNDPPADTKFAVKLSNSAESQNRRLQIHNSFCIDAKRTNRSKQ